MNIEERVIGKPLSEDAKAFVRTVFESAFDHVGAHVERIRIRLRASNHGVLCRARLWLDAGPTVVASDERGSIDEAAHAVATKLARAMQQRIHVDHEDARRRRPSTPHRAARRA